VRCRRARTGLRWVVAVPGRMVMASPTRLRRFRVVEEMKSLMTIPHEPGNHHNSISCDNNSINNINNINNIIDINNNNNTTTNININIS
jgi:hypothetical protein